jgi:hypothetical protein
LVFLFEELTMADGTTATVATERQPLREVSERDSKVRTLLPFTRHDGARATPDQAVRFHVQPGQQLIIDSADLEGATVTQQGDKLVIELPNGARVFLIDLSRLSDKAEAPLVEIMHWVRWRSPATGSNPANFAWSPWVVAGTCNLNRLPGKPGR